MNYSGQRNQIEHQEVSALPQHPEVQCNFW